MIEIARKYEEELMRETLRYQQKIRQLTEEMEAAMSGIDINPTPAPVNPDDLTGLPVIPAGLGPPA